LGYRVMSGPAGITRGSGQCCNRLAESGFVEKKEIFNDYEV